MMGWMGYEILYSPNQLRLNHINSPNNILGSAYFLEP